jgi:hypothetical protein
MSASNVTLELFASLEAFPIVAFEGWNRTVKLLTYVMHFVHLCLISAENSKGCEALFLFAIRCGAVKRFAMLVSLCGYTGAALIIRERQKRCCCYVRTL